MFKRPGSNRVAGKAGAGIIQIEGTSRGEKHSSQIESG
jgi:hypothetical protein